MKKIRPPIVLWFLLIAGCNFGGGPSGTPGLGADIPTARGAEPSARTAGKPNIVFILTDDLDAAAMEYMPNLKTLIAGQGETFSGYFVPESLCCPSRATTLRGQYPHNTRILTNSPPDGGFARFFNLDEEKSTIAVWLQNAGYRTMLAGKYLNGYPLKDDPLHIPPGWTEWYSPVKGNPYGEFNYSLNENGKQVAYGRKPEDYGTDVYVGKALDFIQRNGKDAQPFFIYLAPYAPHDPYTPAPRHADLFPDAKAPRAPNFNETDVGDKPGYIRERSLLTAQQLEQIDEAYRKRLQSLQAVDEGIRSIVDALQADGKLEDTYIFFASDNGYHLGNHRMVLGKIAPYEEELHLTMMVRGPGVPAGKTLDYLTGNVDLAPTWADLAGVATPDFVDGRSLVQLMGNNPPPAETWRRAFPLEYGPDPVTGNGATETPAVLADQTLEPPDQDELDATAAPTGKQKNMAVPPFRGIRLPTLSYVEYRTGEIELYDIRNDPYELNNLASTANPKVLTQLARRMRQLAICKAESCRAAEDAPFDLPKSLTSPVAWIVEPGNSVGVEYFSPRNGF